MDAELFRTAALGLPWGRLGKIVAAAIINADPARHKAKLAAARFDRKVWLSESEDGLRTLVIKADEGNQVLLYALIERIAEILLLDGDTDPVDQRRAKAAGWLARPEDLVVLLYQHAGGRSTPKPPETTKQPTESDDHAEASQPESSEPEPPEPPADWPDYDWDAPEPPFNPGASDRLPKPRTRWYGTEHLPGPEPIPPPWCYEPPPDPDSGLGARLSSDVPRLVDFLTAKGLKPARPRVILQVHLTDQTLLAGDGVVRVEDSGPMLLSQLIELLGEHACQVSLRPVLDPANLAAVDAYEIPKSLREAVRVRHPASVFPFSSRHGSKLEIDHTIAHTRTPDPPGQTRVGNLGPVAQPEHQPKTDGVWHLEQPHPGVFLWRSPHGYYFLVTNQGTQALGPMPAPRPARAGPTVVRLDDRRHKRAR